MTYILISCVLVQLNSHVRYKKIFCFVPKLVAVEVTSSKKTEINIRLLAFLLHVQCPSCLVVLSFFWKNFSPRFWITVILNATTQYYIYIILVGLYLQIVLNLTDKKISNLMCHFKKKYFHVAFYFFKLIDSIA